MISVRGVSKSFGSQVVLNGLDLEIPKGLITTIIGPSGVGKSVLLKLILGIIPIDSGAIFIDSREITAAKNEEERNSIREKLGVLFQSAALFDSLSVYDNIAFPLRERTAAGRDEIHERVVALVSSLSLERYVGLLPQEISIGVRKRVGMARCLITKPEVILFDEPNTGLDPLVGQEVYDLIRECKAKWGFTGVVISHEIPEVFQVSDRLAMIFGGKIIAHGTPEEFSKSTHPVVRQFIDGVIDGPIQIR
jgi:phospholipid/cholesterol/gamma-HCH transport system ATP-binding protein